MNQLPQGLKPFNKLKVIDRSGEALRRQGNFQPSRPAA